MPLVRLEVRNEFGLGNPELYAQANKEDPKAVLDGVAVAGLVGILRQLGDLAEFAAEVFHGLQEQVMTTSSRSHKLMVRVRNIEAALPPLEKVVLAQTSHIHFAYTAGSEWHPRIRNERNHFIYKDLPRFVMDSYEECRDPPRLHLLDKFDTGGPGSCLKRYSDPTFFKRASVTSYEPNAGKVQKERKARRSKKKRSSKRCGDVYCGASISCTHNSSMQFMSPIVDGINSPQTASMENVANNCDFGDHSNSFGSRTESGFVECVFYPSSSMQPEQQEHKESSSKLVQHNETLDYNFSDELVGFVDDNFLQESLQDQITSAMSCVTWDEKAEIFEPKEEDSGTVESKKLQPESLMDLHFGDAMGFRIVDQMECNLTDESILPPISSMDQVDESESETDNYMDALNTIGSESENDVECQTKREVDEFNCDVTNEETGGIHELDMHCVDIHPPLFDSHIASNIFLDKEMPADIGKSVLSENLACEQIPASYISSNNKIPADLLDSICSEGHAFKQISPMARESFNVESSESLHESADICNDSKLEADIDEQIAASYISSNNKLPADLPDSNCLESRAFKQISHVARESSDFGSSESIHESSDICNDSKLEADIDEQIPASYISSNNKIPADLPDSICLEGHAFKQISHIARESTDVGTYESIHESSDICNDSKLQADIDEQIPASYISSNNEIPADLPDSICLEGHAFKQISHIARESTDVGTYESIHESSDICNDSKLQADVDEQIPASFISSNNKIPADLPDSICLEGHAFKQISYIARTCSDIESSEPIHEITDICNDSKLELHIDDPSSSQLIWTNVQDPSADKIASSSLEPQEVLDDLSCKHPIRFWTNGGLLGLEPSKPPDFTKLNDRTQDSVGRNKAETERSSNCWHILKDEGGERKLNNMAESTICDSSSKYSTSCHHDQQNSSSHKMSMGFSSAKLNSKYGNYGDLPMHNGYSNASGTDMKQTTVSGPRMVLPEATGDKSNSSEPNLGNCELPSLVFGLRQRLLSNSFGRKVSNINGDDHIPVISENALEQRSDYQKAPERPREEQFGCAMSKDSLTSSPPLEHMKISFHPVDSFETSKLKLKFSDVNQSPEGIDNPFPSFQLIPEPALPLHDMASDSDDDTFCRSSPYMSEDHLSHHSHSDSEQWESEESPNVKDREGYDALCGISAECISTSPELDGVPSSGICYLGGTRNAFSGNGTLLSLSDPILDLPGFDAMKPPLERETKDDSDPNLLDYGCIGNPSPAPPPLPPVQWCVSKHSSYGTENKDLTSEGFNVLVANNLGSTTIQQPKLPEKQQTNEEPILLIPKAELQLKSFEQKDTNQTLNSRRVDEGEDFLQQIRTKSFNLRRTVTAKSTITPGPPANVKVTAILEKADAIRRAVGSDDGEDDNSWSDT